MSALPNDEGDSPETATVSTLGAPSQLGGAAGTGAAAPTIPPAAAVPQTVQRDHVSVVSGVTNPLLEQQQSLARPRDVPAQVILPEQPPPLSEEGVSSAAEAASMPATLPSHQQQQQKNPVVVQSNNSDAVSAAAKSSPPLPVAATPTRRASSDEAAAATEGPYLQSPEMQNAITEKSPGGRYVRFVEKLGSGASKDVFRAYDTQEGIEVAWNVVSLAGVPKIERNRIINEVKLLERLHHQNIISFHGSWVNREKQEVNFVTEILSSGTLKSFINKVQVVRWKVAKRWAIQILNGLEYLHSQDPPVIHRDLKCDNIFINGTSGDLRIGDLGLSTVHRNNRVHSVLGTPEFMAPDMYEEQSYDEKVDIYAFGMCMLEILSQETPYLECTNPAQIYKRVSSGDPPEVLSRVQSRHAREFVQFCWGEKGPDGRYNRPSAQELLEHPFLVQRSTDDNDVVVLPLLRETTIPETEDGSNANNNNNNTNAPNGNTNTTTTNSTGNREQQQSVANSNHQTESGSGSRRASNTARGGPGNSLDGTVDDEEGVNDHFQEMPETETNIRNVKVLMGRGQKLDRNPPPPAESATRATSTAATPQFVINAAAVVPSADPNVRPYADDILKLVITLPVDGQTQNVQFDFHLVTDDPVKVAKEMVRELAIPQDGVLEVSEAISGLACAARIKQEKHQYQVRSQQQQQQQSQQQQSLMSQQQQSQQQQSLMPQQQQSQQQQPLMPQQQQPTPSSAPAPGGAISFHPHQQQQQQPHDISSTATAPTEYIPPYPPPHTQQHQQQQHAPLAYSDQSAASAASAQGFVPQQQQQQQANPMSNQTAANTSGNPAFHQYTGSQAQVYTQHVQNQVHPIPSTDNNGVPLYSTVDSQQSAVPAGSSYGAPPQQQQQQQHANAAVANGWSTNPSQQTYLAQQQGHMTVTATADSSSQVPLQLQTDSNSSTPTATQSQHASNTSLVPDAMESSSSVASSSGPGSPKSQAEDILGPLEQPGSVETADDSDDEELNAELRKLDEDFQKNLQRATKVFNNRMDSLQRSQVEREAQHRKTLQKHEKERVEFEKRRAQEEEQQNRRLEQMQKEWDKKRETLAQQRLQQNGSMYYQDGREIPTVVVPTPPGIGHARSASSASSALSVSPAAPPQRKSSVAGPPSDGPTSTTTTTSANQTER